MTYEELIQPALWAVALGTAVVYAARGVLAGRNRKTKDQAPALLKRAATVAVGALVAIPAVGVVPAGHRGVVYSAMSGVSASERGEGITLLIPWVQHLNIMSVRTQKMFSDEVYAQSSDLQEITVVASVNYRVEADKAAELYQDVGTDYAATIIQPALFQRTKTAVGQVKAEDFAENRAALAATIQAQLTEQLDSYGIVVEFVNIEDAIFDPAFIQAVKEKVVAEQEAAEQQRLIEAERAKKEQAILQAEARAKSTVIEADAQAKANAVLARSLTPDLLQWRWLMTWDGVLPGTLVSGADSTSFLIDGRVRRAEEV
jgi:prohibitin 2